MRGQLSRETRLEISVTRLKNGNQKLHSKVKELTKIIKGKDQKITELEAKLVDKESQRKELLSYLYKPSKKDEVKKPLGKKPGSPAYHRPIPKEEGVTSEYTYTVKQCPICKDQVGGVVDTLNYKTPTTPLFKTTAKTLTITVYSPNYISSIIKQSCYASTYANSAYT